MKTDRINKEYYIHYSITNIFSHYIQTTNSDRVENLIAEETY